MAASGRWRFQICGFRYSFGIGLVETPFRVRIAFLCLHIFICIHISFASLFCIMKKTLNNKVQHSKLFITKRRRRCELVEIPSDVIPNILSRLPLKSLCRLKCVSKTWRSLIITNIGHQSQRRPIFVERYTNRGVEEYTGRTIYSIHPDGMTTHVCTTMSPPKNYVSHQYHGLFYYYHYAGDVLGVCNPITQEELILPNFERTFFLHYPKFPRFELGFDPLSCNYKVLNLSKYPYCEVHTLGSTSWRKLTKAVDFLRGCGRPNWDMPICVNGIIYLYCEKKHKLLFFHLAAESFQALEAPSACRTSQKSWVINLFEFEGCLCLESYSHSDPDSDSDVITLDFWMLKDVDRGWVMLASIVPPSPAATLKLIRPYQTRAGEIALAVHDGAPQPIFYLYSFLTQQFDAIKAVGLPCDFAVQDFEENLVSLKDV